MNPPRERRVLVGVSAQAAIRLGKHLSFFFCFFVFGFFFTAQDELSSAIIWR
jgi:hypothetical protein